MPLANPRAARMPRVTPSALGISSHVKLLPGGEATLVNVSNTGAQIDGKHRLTVGSKVSVRLQGAAIKRLDGTIVRSQVSTIHRDGTLSYESGIDFDRPYPITEPVGSTAAVAAVAALPDVVEEVMLPDAEEVYVLNVDNDW
jgi:hypothetical protein